MKKRKIAVVTGTRADYPRVRSVLREIERRESLDLYIIATGSHLLREYGYSIQEIFDDGFKVFKEVPIFEGNFNTPFGMAQASAKCTSGIAKVLDEIDPDLVLITVDRVETLASATAASLMNFPIAHIQGGEVTGTIDESIRHAVTKLSHIHFPATQDAAERIIRMGEDKRYVFTTGCPYIDEIIKIKPVSLQELANIYGFNQEKKLVMFTQHSVTTEFSLSLDQVTKTIDALKEFDDLEIICFSSNTDAGGKEIVEKIKNQPNFIKISNMLSHHFLSLMSHSKFMIGNSSAGIREAPSFKLPVINIGSRQTGRLRAGNVIDVDHNVKEIIGAIEKCLFDKYFLNQIKNVKNPYGDGNAAVRIVDILERIGLPKELIQKEICYDL